MTFGARLLRTVKIAILAGGVGLLAMAAIPFGQGLIATAGHNIPSRDIVADYGRGLLWALVLGVSIVAWPVSRRDKRTLLWLWAAKVEVALGVMLLYEWSYGLDAYNYFFVGQPGVYQDDALTYGQGTEIMFWLSHLQWEYLVAESYHAMKLSFAYVGLAGVYFFYRAVALFQRTDDQRALFFIGLFPSTLQWSSILGKDPLSFFGMAVYAFGVVALWRSRRAVGVVALALGVFIAAATRPWMLLIMLAPLVVFALNAFAGVGAKIGVGLAGLALFTGALFLFSDRLQIASMDDVVLRTEKISQSFAYGGSANESELARENSPAKMLAFAPLGAFTALYRPLPGEILNVFGLLASFENAVLVYWTVRAVRRSRLRDLGDPIVSWALGLVAIWAIVYGFVSYHNLGTGARFRLQIIAIFTCLLWHLGRRRAA
ncbi:MAG: hypothetical protein IT381_17000 [Deltaproteobacteria bacterium]|nr:hypothetical protein [Deltaproteobacteria bacterium]